MKMPASKFRDYIEPDYLVFLFSALNATNNYKKEVGKKPKKGFNDFTLGYFYPPAGKHIADYVLWLFDECDIEPNSFIFLKDKFLKENRKPSQEQLAFLENIESQEINIKLIENLLAEDNTRLLRYIAFDIDYNSKSKIRDFLKSYLKEVEEDKIVIPSHYKAFSKQKQEVITKIQGLYQERGKKDLLFEIDQLDEPRSINFIETLLILHFEEYISIITFDRIKHNAVHILINEKLLKEAKKTESVSKKKGWDDVPLIPVPINEWKYLTIKFEELRGNVEICVYEKFYKNSNNVEMGFFKTSTKDKVENKSWETLVQLSLAGGKLDYSKYSADDIKPREKIRQDVSKLNELLIKCFGINDKPIEPIYFDKSRSKVNYYQTKFKIMPEPLLRRDGEVFVGFNKPKDFNTSVDKSGSYHSDSYDDLDDELASKG